MRGLFIASLLATALACLAANHAAAYALNVFLEPRQNLVGPPNVTIIDDGQSPTPPPETPSPTPMPDPSPTPDPIISDPDPSPTPTPIPTPIIVPDPATPLPVPDDNVSSPDTAPTPTPVVVAPPTTSPDTSLPAIDETGGDWPYSGDFVQPFVPSELQADTALLQLLYLAKLDQNACRAQAQYLTERGVQLQKRSLDGEPSKRSLVGVTLCLPPWQTVQVTFHWLVPTSVQVSDVVDSKALTAQIEILRDRLARVHIALKVNKRYVWRQNYTDPLVPWKIPDTATNAGRIKAMKKRVATDQRDHLNVFISTSVLDADNKCREGVASFPSLSKAPPEHDGVFLTADTLPGYTTTTGFAARGWARPGAGLVHEVGHWLNLRHPHDSGCAGDDGMADTKQYPKGENAAQQKACKDKQGGLESTAQTLLNTLSYSSSANAANGNFSQAQISMAHGALWSMRRGMKALPPACNYQLRRRDSQRYPPLVERAPSSLAAICDNTNLRISDVTISDFGLNGLSSSGTPAVTPPFEQIKAADIPYDGEGPDGDDGGQTGVFTPPSQADWEPYPGDTGLGSTTDSGLYATSSTTSTSGGALSMPAVGRLALAMVPLVAAAVALL